MTFPPDTPLLDCDRVGLLWAEDYLPAVIAAIEGARTRLDVAMFILAVGTTTRALDRVRDLADICARAHHRGVACRVLINDFTEDEELPVLNLVAGHYLAAADVPVRQYRSDRHSSIHSKYALIDDDNAFVGSGNWTGGGLMANLEASVHAVSAPLVAILRRRFDNDWQRAAMLERLP